MLSAGDSVLLDLRNVKVFEGEADLIQGGMPGAGVDGEVTEAAGG